MLRFKRKLTVCALSVALLTTACAVRRPGSPIRPGFNLFSKQQDIELGKQAAAEVRQQFQVVQNQELQNYVRGIGEKLAATPSVRESGFPFSFTLLNAKEVNAFALPGGPMFIFSGLISSADKEEQLAGVLAHEISHVVLRHGTNQASKANLLQIPAQIAGAAAGEGTAGQLVNLGLGLGLNGLFLKYSRDDENEADALGARIMAEAGYNPVEMARFFEKLQGEGGSGAPEFLSDHPSPGNRVKAVQAEIQALPQRDYTAQSGKFEQQKKLVAQLPAPPPQRRPDRQASSEGAQANGLRALQTQRFTINVPANWQAFGDRSGSSIALAPQGGLVRGQSNEAALGAGAIISYFSPQEGSAGLDQATRSLIERLSSANPSLRVSSRAKRVTVGGAPALLTEMLSESPLGGNERDFLLTAARPEGLFYVVFVAPDQNFRQLQGAFEAMISTLQFRG